MMMLAALLWVSHAGVAIKFKRRPTRLVDYGNIVHFKREGASVQTDFHDEMLGPVQRNNPGKIQLALLATQPPTAEF